MKIEFFKHNIGRTERNTVNKVLKSLFLTTGQVTKEFEESFARYLGCKKVVTTSSCTLGLFLSLKAYGFGPGDEVITTPMTYIATAVAVIHTGALPIFVDVEEKTGNMNANLIEKAITSKTKAIIPVHLYGQMCDMKKIRQIADKYNLIVIEDAAHAIEAQRDDVRVGQLGDTACFSFYATKNITCGEGGAIATNNEEIAEKLKKLRNLGISKSVIDRHSSNRYTHWDMETLGWRANLDDIHSALLINQLKNIEKYWQRREEICQMYEEAFQSIPELRLIKILPGSKSARYLFTILVSPEKRDKILWKLQEKGIGIAVNYRAIHLLKYFRDNFGCRRGMFPIAEKMGDSTITLPLYPKLTNKEVNYIIRSVKEITAS